MKTPIYFIFVWGVAVCQVGCTSTVAAPAETVETKRPQETQTKEPDLTVPYVPTPQVVVDKMLAMAQVTNDDVVYDLGCGDGRIVVTAAKKYGAKGVGVDLDPDRVSDSLANVKRNGVQKLVEIREGDVLKTDLKTATVVTLYLLPEVNMDLRPILQRDLRPGARVVSHDFNMGDWKPKETFEMVDDDGYSHTIYLWEIGPQKAPVAH